MNEELIQSGRSTRLIEQACKEAWVGRKVYILVHDKYAIKYTAARVDRAWAGMRGVAFHGIEVQSMQTWEDRQLWDWDQMRPTQNIYGDATFLVDHAAVELRLAQVHADIQYLAKLVGKLYPHTV